jgi:hypothetical protein
MHSYSKEESQTPKLTRETQEKLNEVNGSLRLAQLQNDSLNLQNIALQAKIDEMEC